MRQGQDSEESCPCTVPLRCVAVFVGSYDECPCVKSIISCRVVPLVPAPLLREYRTGLLFYVIDAHPSSGSRRTLDTLKGAEVKTSAPFRIAKVL